MSDIHATVAALYAIANNNIYVPVVLSVVEATPASLRVRVTNVVDQAATKLSVTIASITGADGQPLASNLHLNADEDHVGFTLPSTASWSSTSPGFYTLKFTIEAAAGYSERYKLQGVITRTVKVVTDVTGGEFSAAVSESAKAAEGDQVARYVTGCDVANECA